LYFQQGQQFSYLASEIVQRSDKNIHQITSKTLNITSQKQKEEIITQKHTCLTQSGKVALKRRVWTLLTFSTLPAKITNNRQLLNR